MKKVLTTIVVCDILHIMMMMIKNNIKKNTKKSKKNLTILIACDILYIMMMRNKTKGGENMNEKIREFEDKLIFPFYSVIVGGENNNNKNNNLSTKKEEKMDNLLNIKEKEIDLACHPALTCGMPELKDNTITIFSGEYRSRKHQHSLTSTLIDTAEKEVLGKKERYYLIQTLLKRRSTVGAFTNGHYYCIYLIGTEGGGFVTRLDSNIETIKEAKDWLKPAEVKNATGHVYRQGDVFFIEKKRAKIEKYNLSTSHTMTSLENEKVRIDHPEHPSLFLPHDRFKPVMRKRGVGTYE